MENRARLMELGLDRIDDFWRLEGAARRDVGRPTPDLPASDKAPGEVSHRSRVTVLACLRTINFSELEASVHLNRAAGRPCSGRLVAVGAPTVPRQFRAGLLAVGDLEYSGCQDVNLWHQMGGLQRRNIECHLARNIPLSNVLRKWAELVQDA